MKTTYLLLFAALLAGCAPKSIPANAGPAGEPPPLVVAGTAAAMPEIDVGYDQLTLSNGLRVVVHTDRKAPVVAVSVWYHVGSKNEVEGKTGFAHLFEHLMFNGSENFDGEFFEPLQDVGATQTNGTTWFDRTNYFETVPTPALERALWLESDRMGHLLGAVTQEKLDNQRGVVQNEKRQGDNQPYGTVEYRQLAGLFPEGHPYRWSTIGSMEDLNAASLDDVKSWFKEYYGPNNAVLVLAGNIDAATAKPLLEKYFGDIPPGPPLHSLRRWVPTRVDSVRETMTDRVSNARIYRMWVVPPRMERDMHLLRVAAKILGDGKTSRLYERLVYEEQLASSVDTSIEPHELASVFSITINVKQGVDPARVERLLDEEVDRFLADYPTANEVIGARASLNSQLVKRLESVGGFGGKATLLAQGLLYANDPGFWRTALGWVNESEPGNLLSTSRRWLDRGFYQLTVNPYGEPKAGPAAKASVRKTMPEVEQSPDIDFPSIERAKLTNGIEVVFARRDAVPTVSVVAQFDAGYAADQGGILGLSGFALDMMDEGTTSRDALAIAAELERLGASLDTGSTLDTSRLGVSTLASTLEPAVELLADVVQNPAFAPEQIERVRKQRLEAIAQEMVQPIGLALRFLPALIYGEGHPYAIPFTGTGSAEAVEKITRADLLAFRDRWLRPDNATLFVLGDTTLDAVLPLLDEALGAWAPPSGAGTEKRIPTPAAGTSRVVIIDRPASPQTMLLAGHLAPPTGAKNNLAIEAMNDAIGGKFTARVNMNLREDKGWAYGAYTFLPDARGPRPFMVYAPVQTDKTANAMKELLEELSTFVGDKPITDAEFDRITKNLVRSLPGQFETKQAVLGAMLDNARFGRPDDYVATLSAAYRALTRDDAAAAAKEVIKPDQLVWLVVGDRKKVAPEIEKLGLGKVEVLSIK